MTRIPDDPGGQPSIDAEVFGDFLLLRELGRGGQGVVYLAEDVRLHRKVALKVLSGLGSALPEIVHRFRREAEVASRLDHPGICAVHDAGTVRGIPYIVMRHVIGETLASRIAARRRDPSAGPPTSIEIDRIALLGEEIALALHAAHEAGVVHRDIKPGNIMITAEEHAVILDFGVARDLLNDATGITETGAVFGTPAYMSPEQLAAQRIPLDGRTDVYSLGATIYECLTLHPPFEAPTREALYQAVLKSDPVRPRRLNPAIPGDLEVLLETAMEKRRDRRYRSAGELAAELRRFRNREPLQARPAGPVLRLQRWTQRNPVAAGLCVAVLLAFALGILLLSQLSSRLVQAAALENAALQTQLLETFNALYTSEVVDRVRPHGVEVTHDYGSRSGAIPLPASLMLLLGSRLSERESGMQVRQYSDHPFPWRTEGGPRDAFEQTALLELQRAPDRPVHAFEDFQGRPSLRFATARRMRASCVGCHNAHPQSPKRDWKEGDVRGVLEIIRPLDTAVLRTWSDLRGTFTLIALVGALLLGLTTLVFVEHRAQDETGRSGAAREAGFARWARGSALLGGMLGMALGALSLAGSGTSGRGLQAATVVPLALMLAGLCGVHARPGRPSENLGRLAFLSLFGGLALVLGGALVEVWWRRMHGERGGAPLSGTVILVGLALLPPGFLFLGLASLRIRDLPAWARALPFVTAAALLVLLPSALRSGEGDVPRALLALGPALLGIALGSRPQPGARSS